MTAKPDVELQINVAPTDVPHAKWILAHQLRVWGGQVSRVQFTFDLARGHGHYTTSWTERLPAMRGLLEQLCGDEPHARVVEVNYSPAARAAVSDAYFGGSSVPTKDRYGAPFHAYFYGLMSAKSRYVLHMDSDMLFGGGSSTWVRDAVQVMERRPDVLACSPLPGPPTADGRLRSQTLDEDMEPPLSFRARALSTRLFLVDSERLASMAPMDVLRPTGRHRVQCFVEGCVPAWTAEACLSAAMGRVGYWRIDMLGGGPGLWAIHPPYRSSAFYQGLPSLIARVEHGDIPEEQRGRHDVDDSLVDWSDVRPTRARRLRRHARLITSRIWRQSSDHEPPPGATTMAH